MQLAAAVQLVARPTDSKPTSDAEDAAEHQDHGSDGSELGA